MPKDLVYQSKSTKYWYTWINNNPYRISSKLAKKIINDEKLSVMPDNQYENGEYINYGIPTDTNEE